MKIRKSGSHSETLTLVPLADMLTNTVGIMLFILAFTVLASGGVTIAKRLPMERQTEASPFYFVCTGQRVLPLNDDLTEEFCRPLGKLSRDNVRSWVAEFNRRTLADDYFDVSGSGELESGDSLFSQRISLDLSVKFSPKPGKGETKSQLAAPDSLIAGMLRTNAASGKYACFLVYPDGIEVFGAARALAVERFQLPVGWSPVHSDKPVAFSLTGNGHRTRPQ